MIQCHNMDNHCRFCKKSILNKNTFCDSKCQQNLYKEKRIQETIKTGILHQPETQNISPAKIILMAIYGKKCFICKNTEWMNQIIPLVLDHIDGDSTNGKLENCRLVCGNCDMQLPTYKSKNKGKGRNTRRHKYKDSKNFNREV